MTTAQQKMDDAADEARTKLQDLIGSGEDDMNDVSVLVVAAWIKKHYLTAGYKRLCKVLMEEAGLR